MDDTINMKLTDLSWNALLAGWRQGRLLFDNVQTRAEAYIVAAPDELLTPLSELVSLDGSVDRTEIEDALQTLAESEPLQTRLGQREWRAWDANQLLTELQGMLTRSARKNFEALLLLSTSLLESEG
ncbi:hypothetical protein Q0M94_10030 [Deinococcus radiomollis]|uniref:hypothetical protein n=1 Tax=Deinococcus radiomollis TaxID=468916 RepID=UPI00389285AC